VTALPPLLVLTDRRACERRGRTLTGTVEAAVAGGARAFVLREKDLPQERRREQGEALASLLRAVGGVLIVASDPALADELGAGWVHLADADPWPPATAGAGLERAGLGRSCHDAASLRRAQDGGAAYATLSPVFPTASKPGHGPPLGLGGLTRLARTVPHLPIYALGGIDADAAAACRGAGAAGVAVMGAVMTAADPEAATRELLAAIDAGSGG
jgi:thiamine-phosphate pyrophosphorylase